MKSRASFSAVRRRKNECAACHVVDFAPIRSGKVHLRIRTVRGVSWFPVHLSVYADTL